MQPHGFFTAGDRVRQLEGFGVADVRVAEVVILLGGRELGAEAFEGVRVHGEIVEDGKEGGGRGFAACDPGRWSGG